MEEAAYRDMIELVIEERRRSIGPLEVGRVLPFAYQGRQPERPNHGRTKRVRARRGAARAALNRLGREEREVLRARDGLRATLHGELAVDVFQVRLHSLRRDAQGPSDLLVRLTLGHQL